MTTLTKKLWMSLQAMLLIAALALAMVALADSPAQATKARVTVGKLMLPAGAFAATTDDWDFSNEGYRVRLTSGNGNFSASVPFPAPNVRIRKMTLLAHDNSATGDVCAKFYRAQPITGSETQAGFVCTTDSASDPQRPATTAFAPRRINSESYGPYLWVSIGPEGTFYGVQLVFTY